MQSENWVCFDCRTVVRRRKQHGAVVVPSRCSGCGRPLACIGTKIAVPAKSAEQEWQRLRARIAGVAQEFRERENVRSVQEKHAIEKRIAELERLPKNKDRDRLIKSLRQQLQ